MKKNKTPLKRPASGRRRMDSPRVALAVRGIPRIHAALREKYGCAPCMTTLYAVLNGEKENEALVRTVAGLFPDAILPAVAAKYGLPVNLAALGVAENGGEGKK